MSDITEQLQINLLDFTSDKSTLWEKEHKLYSVHFELTPNCNLNCVHCYLQYHHQEEQLSLDQIKSIIDILYDHGVLFITFTGGEVFTRRDFEEIYMYAKRLGFIIEVFSNGVLINDHIVDVFKKYPPLLVDISLYGASDKTYYEVTGQQGIFTRVINNCKAMVSAGIRVAIKAPVLTLTIDDLPQMRKIARSIGVPFRTSYEIIPTIDNDDVTLQYQISYRDMLELEFSEERKGGAADSKPEDVQYVSLKKDRPLFRCKIGRSSCIIDYKGRMCPCMKFKHGGKQITAENFDQVWDSFGALQNIQASIDYKCLSCEAYNYCDICPAEMGFVFGDMEHIEDTYCQCAKARYAFYKKGQDKNDALALV